MCDKCLHCLVKPADKKVCTYRDSTTGNVYHGVREFCSDECEEAYCAMMAERFLGTTEKWERVN